ncbi:hypothetical protein [Streptomyces sp. NPDC048425]|uniref:hypothetical protein n=1 Tax=Streptomyces sp. NPDC048425 TaxID=3365548 RepID=UPI00371C2361
MTLRFIGTTSEHGNCPTLYEVVETGDIVVQGDELTDGEHLAQLRDLGVRETAVVIPPGVRADLDGGRADLRATLSGPALDINLRRGHSSESKLLIAPQQYRFQLGHLQSSSVERARLFTQTTPPIAQAARKISRIGISGPIPMSPNTMPPWRDVGDQQA